MCDHGRGVPDAQRPARRQDPPLSRPKGRLGAWTRSGDPSIYGTLHLDARPILAWLEAARAAHPDLRLTLTHVAAKALADTLAEHPDVNVRLRWNGIHRRADVSVFVHVALTDPRTGQIDLSGVPLRNADQLDLFDLARVTAERVEKVRAGKDTELEKGRDTFRLLPAFLIPSIVRVLELLSVQLNLDLRWMGVARGLRLRAAHQHRRPARRRLGAAGVLLGVPTSRPASRTYIVEDGAVIAAPILPIYATLDHRVLDSAHAAKLSALRARFADPEAWLGDPAGSWCCGGSGFGGRAPQSEGRIRALRWQRVEHYTVGAFRLSSVGRASGC